MDMNPVGSCGSSEGFIFSALIAYVDGLVETDNESEAQASYLPAKASAESEVLPKNAMYLLVNQARYHRAFRRWQAGF